MSLPLIWLLVACALAIAELLTESLFLAPPALAAVALSIGTLIGLDILPLVVLAAGVAAITLLLLKPLMRRQRLDFVDGGTEHDFVVGQMAIVEEHVANREATGAIEIDGEVWTARASDDSQSFAPGTAVEVVGVRGAVALVDRPQGSREIKLSA